MERIDVSEERHMADLVAAVERGEEVVIVRDGAVVAEVKGAPLPRKFDMAALEELHRQFPIRLLGISTEIRNLRDADDG